MIPLFDAAGDRNPFTYNGLTYNQEVDGSKRDIIEVNYCQSQPLLEGLQERREFTDGLEVYGVFKRAKRITQIGLVRASTKAALFDRLEELAAAFDPALVSRDNPDDFGFLPLDFNVPTADTANYPTEVKACRFYVRAEDGVEPPLNLKQGLAVPFRIVLLAADPRRYLQSTESLVDAGVADNGKANYWSWPTVSIAMSGAGSATFEVGNTNADASLVLDLSGRSNGDSVVVDMESHTIEVNGVDTPSLYVSGDFWTMEPGSNSITVTNGTNATVTTTWRPAFSA